MGHGSAYHSRTDNPMKGIPVPQFLHSVFISLGEQHCIRVNHSKAPNLTDVRKASTFGIIEQTYGKFLTVFMVAVSP